MKKNEYKSGKNPAKTVLYVFLAVALSAITVILINM